MSWFKIIAASIGLVGAGGVMANGAGKSWSKEDREALEESPEAHEWSLEEDDGGKIHVVERKKKNGKTYSRRF
jgi:hypothetical protein